VSSKKRYTQSFIVTLFLYGLLFLGVIISFKPLVKPVVLSHEKTIALNHIALVAQEKKVIEEKSIKKEEPKKEPEKRPEKKIEKTKPTPKKEPIKEEKPKPLTKEQPKKNKEVEAEKEEKIKQEEDKKEETKEQEAIQKSNPKTYEEQFLDEHLQEIVKQIQQHIIYPKRAKQLNIQGEVLVEFKISKKGTVENINALQGHVLLKKSALNAIEKASQFFPKVKKDMTIKVPIVYSLI
jgi:protein TonB